MSQSWGEGEDGGSKDDAEGVLLEALYVMVAPVASSVKWGY